jgi:hypothetical protein
MPGNQTASAWESDTASQVQWCLPSDSDVITAHLQATKMMEPIGSSARAHTAAIRRSAGVPQHPMLRAAPRPSRDTVMPCVRCMRC